MITLLLYSIWTHFKFGFFGKAFLITDGKRRAPVAALRQSRASHRRLSGFDGPESAYSHSQEVLGWAVGCCYKNNMLLRVWYSSESCADSLSVSNALSTSQPSNAAILPLQCQLAGAIHLQPNQSNNILYQAAGPVKSEKKGCCAENCWRLSCIDIQVPSRCDWQE
jgi:hypothetical protein